MGKHSGRRVLITGICGELAGQLAARLEPDDRVDAIVGVDLRRPAHHLSRTEWVAADLRNPEIAHVIAAAAIDTIVHLRITAEPHASGGRSLMKERNVIGTMQLLAAAQNTDRLRKVVLKSTTAVYGSRYDDPALFDEDAAPGTARRSGYSKDAVEIEGYARAFASRRPDATLTTLRFANFLGPRVTTPLTTYFALPVVPTVLGYDPRLQFCHERDAVEVLVRSTLEDHPGTFNVAGPGILYLSQAVRRAGKPSVPVALPFVNGLAHLVRRTGRVDFSPEQLGFLLYGRVGNLERMRTDFGYAPAFSTPAAFDDFVATRRLAPLVDRDTAVRWEHRLHDLLSALAAGSAGAGR